MKYLHQITSSLMFYTYFTKNVVYKLEMIKNVFFNFMFIIYNSYIYLNYFLLYHSPNKLNYA